MPFFFFFFLPQPLKSYPHNFIQDTYSSSPTSKIKLIIHILNSLCIHCGSSFPDRGTSTSDWVSLPKIKTASQMKKKKIIKSDYITITLPHLPASHPVFPSHPPTYFKPDTLQQQHLRGYFLPHFTK